MAGQIKVIHDKPIWVGSNDKRLEDVDTTLEFEANLEAEALVVIAGERFDERQRQTLFRLITETNLSSKVALNSDATVDLPPASFLSIEEGHAAEGLHNALSVDIQTSRIQGVQLTVGELLRGFASLQLMSAQHINKAGDVFQKLTRAELESTLGRWGLSYPAVDSFLGIATFKRSSRDLYDCPLIRCADETFMLFGWTMAQADLLKLVLSSISS